MPPNERSPHQIIVEGRNDKYVIINLMMRYGINWDSIDHRLPFIKEYSGIENIFMALSTLIKPDEYKKIGFVFDANSDLRKRWIAIKVEFNKLNIILEEEPSPVGTIKKIGSDKTIGIWLMPDNQSHGRLEDFISKLVPETDCCWQHAVDSSNEAKELGAKFKEVDNIKAYVHTWLTWQEEPGLPLGSAINAHYFRNDSPEALKFVSWFKKLFLE